MDEAGDAAIWIGICFFKRLMEDRIGGAGGSG
jgi:hypothetical protein